MNSFARSRIALLFAGISLTALVVLAADKAPGKKESEAAKLIGNYKIVSGERNGEKIADDHVKAVSVRITADTITTLDMSDKKLYVATYSVDTQIRPWRVTMTATVVPGDQKGKGASTVGLIERQGDTVKLIYALPGGQPPSIFKTADKQQMFVMKRGTM